MGTKQIRRAVPNDAIGIAALEKECFPDPWCEKDILAYICAEDGMAYTALDDGKLAAYLIGRVIAPEGEIYRIAVSKEHRRRGLGYRLLSFALKSERGNGLETTFLEVRSKNDAALALYRAYGFRECGKRKNYYHNPDDDAVVMILGLKDEFDN